jgi:hypothetical protein
VEDALARARRASRERDAPRVDWSLPEARRAHIIVTDTNELEPLVDCEPCYLLVAVAAYGMAAAPTAAIPP